MNKFSEEGWLVLDLDYFFGPRVGELHDNSASQPKMAASGTIRVEETMFLGLIPLGVGPGVGRSYFIFFLKKEKKMKGIKYIKK